MWIASPLPASTLAIFRLRTMTLLTPLIFRPQPVRPELEPTPRIVLLDVTVTSDEQVKFPLNLIVSDVLEPAALVSADRLVTVTVVLDPPEVPPAWVDQPSWLYVAAEAAGALATRAAATRVAA